MMGDAQQPQRIALQEFERDLASARGSRLGPAAGSSELGCALFELDPGAQATPYHSNYGNEELLIVLEGDLELRTPDGTRPVTTTAPSHGPRRRQRATA